MGHTIIKAGFAVALLLGQVAAAGDLDPRFIALRDSAEPLGGLGAFLDKYVGECGALESAGNCAQTVKAYRDRMRGKKLFMIVNEENASMLSPGAYDFRNGEYHIQITPFFPSNGYALTQGAPKRTDANGNPVMPLLTVKGQMPDEWNQARFSRLFSNRELRVHVVFTPEDVWNLPKRGGGKISGVRAKIHAILVTGRTGETLGLWMNK